MDGLKETNDSLGHAAGDLLLRKVVQTLRTHVRAYDLIVRFGGDEFVCALLALDTYKATERFTIIRASRAAAAHASISVGLAGYQIHDSLDEQSWPVPTRRSSPNASSGHHAPERPPARQPRCVARAAATRSARDGPRSPKRRWHAHGNHPGGRFAGPHRPRLTHRIEPTTMVDSSGSGRLRGYGAFISVDGACPPSGEMLSPRFHFGVPHGITTPKTNPPTVTDPIDSTALTTRRGISGRPVPRRRAHRTEVQFGPESLPARTDEERCGIMATTHPSTDRPERAVPRRSA